MKTIQTVFDYLEGKKTYIVAFLVAVVTFAGGMGWIDTATVTTLVGFLSAGGLATLRMAVGASAPKAKKK